jgi:Fe2+ or Zn2+ uptake regulation protein
VEKRQTIQRQLIFDAVKTLNTHATAEEVYAFIHRSQPTISKATVYRNLSQMAQSGDILNIGHINGALHYDHNNHPHHHFVCDVCHRVYDVEGDFSSILAQVALGNPHKITRLDLSFSGACERCKDERE